MKGTNGAMNARLALVLEHPIGGIDARADTNPALARIVEAHPALAPLLDFCATDPSQIALAVGMVHAGEEDGLDDLSEIDFGQDEWFEPAAGLAAVRRALLAVQSDPRSIAAVLYDPELRAEDVIADLQATERGLMLALQHETRFHFLQNA
jgi:hypothetical protein